MGINLNFKENSISWVDYQADMKDTDITLTKHIAAVEAIMAVAMEMAKILDAKYRKVDLCTDIVKACNALNTGEKEQLFQVLRKHEELFGGVL
eukprot:10852436-Ditylum_brightwellii.AAC.1